MSVAELINLHCFGVFYVKEEKQAFKGDSSDIFLLIYTTMRSSTT